MAFPQLFQTWLGPTDPLQRRAKVGIWLAQSQWFPIDELHQWLRWVCRGDGPAQEALLCCCDPRWWHQQLGEEQIHTARQKALAQKFDLANLWLMGCDPSHWQGESGIEATLIHPTLRQMTLGARRSLARHATSEQLIALIVDPDPIVLAHALAHPKMTESIVMLGCSQFPTSTTHLWALMEHWRWFVRPEVRYALLSNRALPIGLGICLLFTQSMHQLKQLLRDGLLSPMLQRSAQLVLAERMRSYS